MLWDPTGWLIWFLHKFTPLIPKVHRVPEADVHKAQAHMFRTEALKYTVSDPKKRAELEAKANETEAKIPKELRGPSEEVQGRVWGRTELERYVFEEKRKVLLVHGWALDVTKAMTEHVRGIFHNASSTTLTLDFTCRSPEALLSSQSTSSSRCRRALRHETDRMAPCRYETPRKRSLESSTTTRDGRRSRRSCSALRVFSLRRVTSPHSCE